VRLFVAADPSPDLRRQVAARSGALRAGLGPHAFARRIRWVPDENLHLTVWFLGEVSDERSLAVIEALRTPMRSPSFDLHVSGFGAFPPSGSPRVLWLGVPVGLPRLAIAHDEIGSRLAPLGFKGEARPYSAHLTIARIKSPLNGAERAVLRGALDTIPAEAGSCRIETLTLYRSRTSSEGAVYEPLLRVPLS
jgi:2'-5' RNA ligase